MLRVIAWALTASVVLVAACVQCDSVQLACPSMQQCVNGICRGESSDPSWETGDEQGTPAPR